MAGTKDIHPEVRAYFSALGKKAAGKGGKKALETMTPEERKARAQKAAAKSAQVRTKKARAKKKAATKKLRG